MRVQSRWVLRALAAFLVGGLTGFPARAAVEGSFQRTLPVSGAVNLDVSTGSGNITVRAGAAGTVEIRGKIRASSDWRSGEGDAEEKVRYLESHPPIEQDGNTIRVGHISDPDLAKHISISYDIVTPSDTRLHSASGSGDQTLEGLQGPLDCATGSGNLSIANIGADVRASTGSGDIKLETVRGGVRVSTGSGSIHGTGIAGAMVASTGSGSVRLQQTAAGKVEVSTGSGDVELDGVQGSARVRTGSGEIRAQGTPAGEWSLHSASGGVSIRLPKDVGFELNARTESGNIVTSRAIEVVGTINRRQLHGTAHGGGPLLDLSTSSGNIQID